MLNKPNIILVLTDDQGYGDIGCSGNSIINTPNIDAFYEKSIRFTNYHVGPTCAPTRAGIFTGHYANSTGVWHTIGGRSLLRKDEWTLASALKEDGYCTGLFGKWHLGDMYPYRPQDRGFDCTVIHGGGGISQTPDYWGNDYFDDIYMADGKPRKYEGYCTDVWFKEAIKFIEAKKNYPFFCCITPNAPHWPYNVEKKYRKLYEKNVPEDRARFYGMITNIDENFGMLLDKINELGMSDNTIIIFMTDNGSSCGASVDKNQFVTDGFNAGLRGIKNSEYDGGHRVPFFIYYPKKGFDYGRDIDSLTSHVDIMPTLLDMCNVEEKENHSFHGRSLLPLLSGNSRGFNNRVVVTDSQRVANPIKWRKSSVMTDRWRLINGKELYDIRSDREQRNDIASDNPRLVKELRNEYENWWEIVSSQFHEEIPISIGAEIKKETLINCHDWRNKDCSCPWHQGHIRQAFDANGYWEINIENKGVYRFELRRWPRELDLPLNSPIEFNDISWKTNDIMTKDHWLYKGGESISAVEACLKIGNEIYRTPVSDTDVCVKFEVELSEKDTHLQTWFIDKKQTSIGAYYVYVKMIKKV